MESISIFKMNPNKMPAVVFRRHFADRMGRNETKDMIERGKSGGIRKILETT